MRGRENNQIPIPNGGKAEFLRGMDFQRHIPFPVLNRLCPALLQRQKRVFHTVPVIPPRRVNRVDRENLKLDDITHGASLSPHPKPRRAEPSEQQLLLWKYSWYRMQSASWYRMQVLVVSDAEVQNYSEISN